MANLIKQYIESKIIELQKVSDPKGYLTRLASVNPEFRRLWRSELDKDNECLRKINTNDDVIKLIDLFEGQVQFVEKYVPFGSGHAEDGYKMALAEYRALQGLRKMAQFIDPHVCNTTNFTPLSEAEIDKLFNRMVSIIARKDQQDMRRMMQD